MAYLIEYTPKARRQITKLPSNLQQSITGVIEQLATDPRPPGVTKLKGFESLFRVRYGNYRIIYEIQDDALLIIIASLGDRKDVYRRV